MDLNGKVAVVTGAGGGIGSALARAALDAGAKVAAADLDGERAAATIADVDADRAIAVGADVSDEAALRATIERAEDELGPVDVFFANAGVGPGAELGTEGEWELALGVNVMAHVRAARLLLPRWLERGGGYFVSTASAAGLLTQIGSAPYAVSKHAAVGFAEWLSVTYGERGVRVSCLCPMGVRTAMVEDGSASDDRAESLAARTVAAAGTLLEPEEVARETLAAVAEERFLILPHPEVLDFYRRKGADYDRWLGGMRRLQRQVDQAAGSL